MRHFVIVLFQIRLRRAIVRVGIGNRVIQIHVRRTYVRPVIPVTAYMRVAAYIPEISFNCYPLFYNLHFCDYAASGLQDSAAPTYELA